MEEIKVYTILKSLYGFCQVPISWYTKIDTYLKHQSLKRNEVDYNLYYMKKGIILAYDWEWCNQDQVVDCSTKIYVWDDKF